MLVRLIRKMKAAFAARPATRGQAGLAREARPPSYQEVIAAKRRRAKARRKQRKMV